MSDPAVLIALFAAVVAVVGSLTTVAVTFLGFRNQQQAREAALATTLAAVKQSADENAAITKEALDVTNHVNDKIVRLNEDNKNLHKEIKAVLGVAESVKKDTGEHKPLGKDDVAAVAQGVVQAIRATGPLAPTTGD